MSDARDKLVARALASPTGRVKLAEAMGKRIREGLITRCPHCGTVLENWPRPAVRAVLPHGVEECVAAQVLDS